MTMHLIARLTLADHHKNMSQLSLRVGANYELILSLNGHTCGPEALTNMGCKGFPPSFMHPSGSEKLTVEQVITWVSTGYRTITNIEARTKS